MLAGLNCRTQVSLSLTVFDAPENQQRVLYKVEGDGGSC